MFRSWWRKTTLDGGSGDNGTIPDAFQREYYLVRVHFTARPEGKVNSQMKRTETTIKEQAEAKKKERKQGSEMLSGPKPQIKI